MGAAEVERITFSRLAAFRGKVIGTALLPWPILRLMGRKAYGFRDNGRIAEQAYPRSSVCQWPM